MSIGICGIVEAYIKHRNDLEIIGFSDSNGPGKLPYLERALAVGERDEVFNNLMNMSQREFADFAKSGIAGIPEDVPFLEIRGHSGGSSAKFQGSQAFQNPRQAHQGKDA